VQHFQLIESRPANGQGKPIYYANGQRITREKFENIARMARMFGRRDSFTTTTQRGRIQQRSAASF
jgi:hypothetical protein